MVASVQKNTTEFLTEYLHFSCPFDNFLRCLACATYIAVGKKFLSTPDVHGQYRNQKYTQQVNSCQPGIGTDIGLPCQTASEIIPAGNIFIEPGNTKEGLTAGSAQPNSREHFLPLCWCSIGSATAGEWFLLQFFRELEEKSISHILQGSSYPQVVLQKPTLPLHKELTQRPL